MPRAYHLDVVPMGEGAHLFLRDGHGNFVQGEEPFNKFQPTEEKVVEAVKEFLQWERPA
jgi:hypothetical protein